MASNSPKKQTDVSLSELTGWKTQANAFWADLKTVLNQWCRNIKSRRSLTRLLGDNPQLLKDVGISVFEARLESKKVFWKK